MNVFWELSLLRPFWVLALPIIFLLALRAARRRSSPGDWSGVIDPHLMSAMAELGRIDHARGRWRGIAPFAVAGLVAIALLGPALERGKADTFRNLDGVVFLVDVSASMTRDQTWPATVGMALAGLSVLGTRPAALIVFAGDAYVASTFTTDHRELGQTIALLDDKTVPDKGNRPSLALEKAASMLRDAQILEGDVILLTDGGGVSTQALNGAAVIADLNARLSVVHVATTLAPSSSASTAEMEAFVSVGGGGLYELGQAEELLGDLKRASALRLEKQAFQFGFWTDYGRYLLLLALVPAAAFFRRESV